MNNKKVFWSVIFIIIIIIYILTICSKKNYKTFLLIETAEETIYELSFDEVISRKGINFDDLETASTLDDYEVIRNNNRLKEFHESYLDEKGKNLIKIIFVDQIFQLTPITSNYSKLIFHSDDGAKVSLDFNQLDSDLILISIEKNGGKYSLRLILPDDSFSQRWLKNIVKITVYYENEI
jgi:hypothetical protein